MKKFVAAVAFAVAAVGAHAELAPGQAFPLCAGVYATLAVYAKPSEQAQIKQHASEIAAAGQAVNPNTAKIALELMNDNIQRVRANDPQVAQEVGGAEKFCRSYLKQYGL